MNLIEKLQKREVLPKGGVPHWLPKSIQYLATVGSISYGCNLTTSDKDLVGFCIPPKDVVFPHTSGILVGFDKAKVFEQWQLHHVQDTTANGGKGQEYDFSVYGIIRYFKLCMDCNANMIDSLFVDADCVLHCTPLAGMVRSNKDLFLCKKAFHTFTGYLHSQVAKLDRKPEGLAAIEEFEAKHNISNKTTFQDVIEELEKRDLKTT